MKKQLYERSIRALKGGLSVVVLGSALLISGCDVNKLSNAVDDFEVVVSLEPINTAVAGQFVDVTTGELIERDITVTFTGPDGDRVVDIFSEPLGDLSIDGGLMTFGISNEANPSESNPVKVNVVASADGFVTNSSSLSIDEEGNHQFLIYMKPENSQVEGSESAENSGSTGSDGSISTDLDVETSQSNSNDGGTAFKVKAGTRALDANGNSLSGNLRAKITHYNPQSETAQRLLPGELPVAEGKTFTPVTFNNLEMTDQQGRRAKSFSNNVDVSSRLPDRLINPNTGRPYEAGQMVGVFSFDESNGEWVSEGTRELKQNGDDNGVQVDFETDHFSTWMLGSEVPACEEGSVFNLNWQNARRDIQLKVTPNSDVTGPRTITVPSTVDRIRIPASLASLIPNDIGVTITAMTSRGEEQVGPTNVNLCGGQYNISIPVEEVVDGVVSLELACPSPSQNVNVDNVPTSAIYYRQVGSTQPWYRFNNSVEWNFDEENNSLQGGSLQVQGLIQGASYILKTVFDGETYQTDVTLNSTDSNFRMNGNGTFDYTLVEDIEGDLCS